MTRIADPLTAPAYLLAMPRRVLLGKARGIEQWCAEQGKARPTLLHLELARRARLARQASA